ncbi:damage-inducible protein [uncultured Bradyrhizobium sp.]|uniref:ImuA family protein n=1 Tax=uncultured Bradyrhizobium sp. TaxID=199684 RepID=UPI002619F652|nr:damage-inducible protein [uncultured Bradyrhizobium sp.]
MSAALDSFAPSIAHLRTIATPAADYRVMPFGVEALDGRLGAGGRRAGALHEATARSAALVDDAATTLFLAGIAAREAAGAGGPVLWASCRADLYAPALEQAGLPSANVIYAQPRDDAALLAVVEDAVRDGTPAAIVAEASKISMVATRRLQLVAADADMPVLLLRRGRGLNQDVFAEPSAAWTRWRIGAAPSERLGVAGVGRARWAVECVRQRGGEGFSLIVEGSDETGRLAVPAELGRGAAETAGTVRFAAA